MPILNASSVGVGVGVGSISSLCFFHSPNSINDSPTNYCSSSFSLNNYSPCNYKLLNLCSRSTINTKNSVHATQINASSDAEVEEAANGSPVQPVTPASIRRHVDWEAAKRYKETGSIYRGRIEGFNGGGLLIRFSSLVGFIPFPQLSPTHSCKDPTKPRQDIAKGLVGSMVPVKVIEVNEDSRKLIMSEKEAIWSYYSGRICVGDVLEGKVGMIEDFGAFVHLRLPDGSYHFTGLVHGSEVSWDFVQDVRDYLSEGDVVRVKVIHIDRVKLTISLSIKQLAEDPLLETLDKVIPQDDTTTSPSIDIEPLQGLEEIIRELLNEEGISEIRIRRQGFEKRVVSPDLQLWLSNAPAVDNNFVILARAGRQVQEMQLRTTLDQEGVKRALQNALERVP